MNKWLSKIDYKKVNMIMDAISALSIIGMIVCTFFLWKNSSDRVPMHYNFNGEVDTYGSKSSMLILLFIDVICYVGIALLSKYPEVYNYCVEINEENREKQFLMAQTFMKAINAEITVIFFYIQLHTLIGITTGRQNLSVGFMPLFLIILFFSNVVQGITGFAGTVLAMPPSACLIGLDNAKVILNVMALISGLLIAIMNYKNIRWKELIKIIIFMIIGMVVGIKICELVNSDNVLLTVYGIVIFIIALKNLILKNEVTVHPSILLIVLLLSGIIHGMFVSGGALLVVYAVQVFKDKDEFRATIAPVWVVLNTYMAFSQYKSGLFTSSNINLILLSIIPLFIATWVGGKLSEKLDKNIFLNLTYILLILSGMSLIL